MSRCHIGQKELNKVGMLSVNDRVIQLKLNHVFKIFHNIAPEYLKVHFTRISAAHSHSTRGSPFNFVVPLCKGNGSHTFYNTAIHHWNSLPKNIKQIQEFSLFRKCIKTHLAGQDD